MTIVKLKLDKNRKLTLERRGNGRELKLGKKKGKYTEETAMDTTSPGPSQKAEGKE